MSDYIIGIDIGSFNICAAAGKLDKYGKMQIMGITSSECNGVKKGVVVDIDNTSESIKKCIYELERMIDIKIQGAYIALPGGLSELMQSKGIVAVSSEDGEVTENDVKRVLKAAKIITIPSDKEVIGVIAQQYIIDGYDKIKDPIGMSGVRLEVDAQVILAQSTIVNNLFKSVNKAGIKVMGLVFEPMAISKVVLKEEEIQRGVVLVDMGADSVNIYDYEGGKINDINTIGLGGNTITNDISVCLKVPISCAEKLKKKYGAVGYANKDRSSKIEVNSGYNGKTHIDYNILVEVIEARIEELLLMINNKLKVLKNYESISEIVIVGGGISQIKGIEEFSRKILDKPVRIGSPNYIGASSPIYAVVAGIVEDAASSMKVKHENKINEYKDSNKKSYENWTEASTKEKENYENSGFVSKIKEFFTDFF